MAVWVLHAAGTVAAANTVMDKAKTVFIRGSFRFNPMSVARSRRRLRASMAAKIVDNANRIEMSWISLALALQQQNQRALGHSHLTSKGRSVEVGANRCMRNRLICPAIRSSRRENSRGTSWHSR
jgi:hypothetical protein